MTAPTTAPPAGPKIGNPPRYRYPAAAPIRAPVMANTILQEPNGGKIHGHDVSPLTIPLRVFRRLIIPLKQLASPCKVIESQGGAMQFLSLVGLVVLLGLAWAMSYHPRRVRVRTVVWGLGLQFVFALIILKEDNWSFIGMVVLAALLVVYIMQESRRRCSPGVKGVAAVLVAAAVIGGLAGAVGVPGARVAYRSSP